AAGRRGGPGDPRAGPRPDAGARHLRPLPAAEPRLPAQPRTGERRAMSGEPCAIIGIGQTHHKSKRLDVSLAELVREAASRALEDAGLDWPDIDSVVLGKAPDAFEGVMMPELYLA